MLKFRQIHRKDHDTPVRWTDVWRPNINHDRYNQAHTTPKEPGKCKVQGWKITKDKPRIGPPLGGAICFTVQATGLVYEPTGAMSLVSLFAALVIGTTSGWLVEETITKGIALMRKSQQP